MKLLFGHLDEIIPQEMARQPGRKGGREAEPTDLRKITSPVLGHNSPSSWQSVNEGNEAHDWRGSLKQAETTYMAPYYTG